jgi:hypothetical protein
MIPENERVIIKKLFGANYPNKILKRLAKKKVKNRNGQNFQAQSIRDVLNGRSHSVLQDEIRAIWKEEIEARENLNLVERSKSLVS